MVLFNVSIGEAAGICSWPIGLKLPDSIRFFAATFPFSFFRNLRLIASLAGEKKMSEEILKCPECGSQSAWKYGTGNNSVIGYVCKNCTCHFTRPWVPPKEGLKCPTCGGQRLWRDGSRYLPFDESVKIQRWLCKDCGYRFSEKSLTPI